jgi:hypothetical protein
MLTRSGAPKRSTIRPLTMTAVCNVFMWDLSLSRSHAVVIIWLFYQAPTIRIAYWVWRVYPVKTPFYIWVIFPIPGISPTSATLFYMAEGHKKTYTPFVHTTPYDWVYSYFQAN